MDRDPLNDLKYYYLPLVDKKTFNTSLQLIEKKTPHFFKKFLLEHWRRNNYKVYI